MSDETTTQTEKDLAQYSGRLVESLTRGSKKIKADRALAIVEGVELKYKRTIEDLVMDMKNLERERENQLDLSPTTSDSLELAKNFDAAGFVQRDLLYGLQLREISIKLEIARERYSVLFGKSI